MTVAAVVVALWFLPRKYISSASLLPDNQQSSSPLSALLGQGGLPFGLGLLGGGGGSAEIHREILGSYRICQRVVEALDLYGPYDLEARREEQPLAAEQAAVATLQASLVVSIDDRSGMLRVTVSASTPTLARDLVSQLVAELDRFNQETLQETGRRKARFLTERLEGANAELAAAQEAMEAFSIQEGIVHLPSELEAELALVSELSRQLVFKELERATVAQDDAPDAPARRRLEAEISVLRSQLDILEHGGGNEDALRLKPLQELPALTQRYYELKRELGIQEEIANLLVQQLEQARFQAASTVPTLSILDPPREATLPAWPRKKLVVAGATLAGFFFFSLCALSMDFYERVRRNEDGRWQSWQWLPGSSRAQRT